MHLVLTGEKQVGKSTLVKALLTSTERPIQGIKSVSIFENGDRVVYLFPIGETEISKENGVKAGICRKHQQIERHPEAFDTYGVDLLSAVPSGTLVVIDEIGNMERDATLYSDTILSLFDRTDVRILCVLQKMAATPLAEAIRNHGNVRLIEVTTENRTKLTNILKGETI